MLNRADVVIRREVDSAQLFPLTQQQAASENGLMLNHDYMDVRGCTITDARDALAEEAELLGELEASGWSDDKADELMDEAYETSAFIFSFDIGMAGAVFALSAAGAAPISSCNGGVIDGERHASDVPHVLFSATPDALPAIERAAVAADAGLINNDGHVELFADWLPKLHSFAEHLLIELEGRAPLAEPMPL